MELKISFEANYRPANWSIRPAGTTLEPCFQIVDRWMVVAESDSNDECKRFVEKIRRIFDCGEIQGSAILAKENELAGEQRGMFGDSLGDLIALSRGK